MRNISFDLHDLARTPSAMEQLDDVLCEFGDVCSTSITDVGSCYLMPFKTSVPEGSTPVISLPHRGIPISDE